MMPTGSKDRRPADARPVSLTIYMPTWGRPEDAIAQVRRLDQQRHMVTDVHRVSIVVSINGDASYEPDRLLEAGADSVTFLPVNAGGEVNYCLGWLAVPESEFLWILSDDDPVVDGALARLLVCLARNPDLVICSRSSEPWSVSQPNDVGELESMGAVLALYSASVFRRAAFTEYLPQAFAAVFSLFPQVELIRSAVEGGACSAVAGVPMEWIIDYSAADDFTSLVRRSEIGSTHGQIFFGSGLLAAFRSTPSASRRSLSRWWRSNWHRASMYRRSRSRNEFLVDSISRGQMSLLPLYVLSLPPWWRVKDLVDRLRARREDAPSP